MQHGKDFHSTFVERSQRVVWLNKEDMYSRQGFFVTKLLLLLCAGFVMPLERIERNKSLTGLFGKKLNRALRQNGQKYFQEFVENEEWNFWIVFTAGFTPIPFKLITISSGTFNINFFMFIIASTLSRSARFLLLGALIFVFGEKIRFFIEKYFNLLVILFTILLITGFVVIKLFID